MIAAHSLTHYILAWIPFLHPLPLSMNRYFLLLLIPIAFAIAIVYKTLKLHDLAKLPQQTFRLTITIIAIMIALAVTLSIITYYF